MMKSSTTGDRCAAFFLLGLVVFNPPLLSVFSREVAVAGIPLLYVYLFAAWAALIGLIAVTVKRPANEGRPAAGRRPASKEARQGD